MKNVLVFHLSKLLAVSRLLKYINILNRITNQMKTRLTPQFFLRSIILQLFSESTLFNYTYFLIYVGKSRVQFGQLQENNVDAHANNIIEVKVPSTYSLEQGDVFSPPAHLELNKHDENFPVKNLSFSSLPDLHVTVEGLPGELSERALSYQN